jgi:signal-transduction protein with cAMP-binding, CBS, and nucleotidyltransferase domain
MGTDSAFLLRIAPDVVKQARVHALPDEASAEQAAQVMAQAGAGAVVVFGANGRFAGLVTEQDIVREVVAKGVNAGAAKLATLVSGDPECLAPSDLALDALDLMRIRNVSHLPVIVDEQVIAVVSIGDICAAVHQTLEGQLRARGAALFSDLHWE